MLEIKFAHVILNDFAKNSCLSAFEHKIAIYIEMNCLHSHTIFHVHMTRKENKNLLYRIKKNALEK